MDSKKDYLRPEIRTENITVGVYGDYGNDNGGGCDGGGGATAVAAVGAPSTSSIRCSTGAAASLTHPTIGDDWPRPGQSSSRPWTT